MSKNYPPDESGMNEHWKRFRRLVWLVVLAAVVAAAAALIWLKMTGTTLHLHLVVSTVLGVGASMLIGGILMALVFHSARSGADEAGENHSKGNDE